MFVLGLMFALSPLSCSVGHCGVVCIHGFLVACVVWVSGWLFSWSVCRLGLATSGFLLGLAEIGGNLYHVMFVLGPSSNLVCGAVGACFSWIGCAWIQVVIVAINASSDATFCCVSLDCSWIV